MKPPGIAFQYGTSNSDGLVARHQLYMFDQRVLPITEDIMLLWRLLVEDGRKTGHTFSQPDLIIAATALHYGLTVVTRDRSDYDKARAPVMNPWDAPPPHTGSGWHST